MALKLGTGTILLILIEWLERIDCLISSPLRIRLFPLHPVARVACLLTEKWLIPV